MTVAARLRRILADNRGVLAVEFALCVPVITLLTIGIVDYGMSALTHSTIDAAARSGLQIMLGDPTNTTMAQNAAVAVAPDATALASSACFCADGSAVACTGACAVGRPQTIATVAVSQSYTWLFPWPGLDNPMTLTATAKGRVR